MNLLRNRTVPAKSFIFCRKRCHADSKAGMQKKERSFLSSKPQQQEWEENDFSLPSSSSAILYPIPLSPSFIALFRFIAAHQTLLLHWCRRLLAARRRRWTRFYNLLSLFHALLLNAQF
jgi:hypothetical protein